MTMSLVAIVLASVFFAVRVPVTNCPGGRFVDLRRSWRLFRLLGRSSLLLRRRNKLILEGTAAGIERSFWVHVYPGYINVNHGSLAEFTQYLALWVWVGDKKEDVLLVLEQPRAKAANASSQSFVQSPPFSVASNPSSARQSKRSSSVIGGVRLRSFGISSPASLTTMLVVRPWFSFQRGQKFLVIL